MADASLPTDPVADEPGADDDARLRHPRLARTALIAGAASLLLAPIVVGFVPAAIGIHSARSHLAHRVGSRALAWTGIVLSAIGGLGSTAAAITFGAILMTVLLQRSALDQSRAWIGTRVQPWSFVAADGTTHGDGDAADRITFVNIFSPGVPMCDRTTRIVAAFATAHADILAISWAPDGGAEAVTFATERGAAHSVAVGPQEVGYPFSLVAAKPTLIVIDSAGIVRAAVLGPYDAEGLATLLEIARTPYVAPKNAPPAMPRPS